MNPQIASDDYKHYTNKQGMAGIMNSGKIIKQHPRNRTEYPQQVFLTQIQPNNPKQVIRQHLFLTAANSPKNINKVDYVCVIERQDLENKYQVKRVPWSGFRPLLAVDADIDLTRVNHRWFSVDQIHLDIIRQQLMTSLFVNKHFSFTNFLMTSTLIDWPSLIRMRNTTVLRVGNLNKEKVTPEALFTLFGVYGDVVRVKILYQNQSVALVQTSVPEQAQRAVKNLSNVELFGRQMIVRQSEHQIIHLPKTGHPDSGLTRSFADSPLHRFADPKSKNNQHVYKTSATLCLSNIPEEFAADQVKTAFRNVSHLEPVSFQFSAKNRRMAFVRMNSVAEAVDALVAMHNYQLSTNHCLKVNFSRFDIDM